MSAQPRGKWAVAWEDRSGQRGHSGALDKRTAQTVRRAHEVEGKRAHITPCRDDLEPSDMPVAVGGACGAILAVATLETLGLLAEVTVRVLA